MQQQPTYTYEEFMEHIEKSDEHTHMILLELICDEVRFYTREQVLNIYENLHTKFNTNGRKRI